MNTIYEFHVHHVHAMYINPYLFMRLRVVSKHLHNPNGNIDWMTGFIAKPCCTKPMHLNVHLHDREIVSCTTG